MASSRVPYSSVFPAFRPLAKLVPPTTPSADFSAAITSLTTRLVQCPGHNGDLPRFDRLPCTPAEFTTPTLDDHGLRNQLLVRSGRPRYPVFVHRAAGLLHASFRLRLATTPLRFANPSPSSGWLQDFHLQAVEHARHTTKKPPGFAGRPLFLSFCVIRGCRSGATTSQRGAVGRRPARLLALPSAPPRPNPVRAAPRSPRRVLTPFPAGLPKGS